MRYIASKAVGKSGEELYGILDTQIDELVCLCFNNSMREHTMRLLNLYNSGSIYEQIRSHPEDSGIL